MNILTRSAVATMSLAALVSSATPAFAHDTPPAAHHRAQHAPSRHVLVISVDGLHERDLQWYIATHPHSAMAQLVAQGTDYTNARTTYPSDSFPGMVAQFTGAQPGTSGVFYDDTYSTGYDAPGTTNCAKATPGTEVAWTEGADRSQNPITLDAGEGLNSPALKALPTNTKQQTLANSKALTAAILKLTPNAKSLLDPKNLPVDPATCKPVYPNQYLRTNTVFNVASAAGLRTAWSDKHPAYQILDGKGGSGVSDFFTPEINSVADKSGDDWSTDNALTREYDSFKVAAVLNEIRGYDHSGATKEGTPAIFGMNFQSVSTAQKLPTSDGMTGGYAANGTPGPLLRSALDYVDTQLGAMQAAVRKAGLAKNTTIILSAKHGQSPMKGAALRRVDDGKIMDALNAGWAKTHKGAKPLVAFSVNDDNMMIWLSDHSAAAYAYVRGYLMGHSAPANTIKDAKGVYSTSVKSSGIAKLLTGAAAKASMGAQANDNHAPDVVGLTQYGVVYTGGVKKIAEHGGDSADDRNVALVVSGAGVKHGATNRRSVQTASVAPSILKLLGLNPNALTGAKADRTGVLPGIR